MRHGLLVLGLLAGLLAGCTSGAVSTTEPPPRTETEKLPDGSTGLKSTDDG
jgi:hypothetical protein